MKTTYLLKAGLAVGVGLSASVGVRAEKPNIIFILCDDLGYGDLGVLYQNARVPGLPKQVTPNLDLMASSGIQLRSHYCPAPVCAPSRASLLSGVHQGHATVRDNQFDKELEDNHTLATVLRRAGYSTAAIGKWGLQGDPLTAAPDWEAHPLRRGFDDYYGYISHSAGHYHYPKENKQSLYDNYTNIASNLNLCYTTDLFTARAKKWIVDHLASPEKDKPMFLYLAYDTPHAILQNPPCPYPSGGGLSGGVQWIGTPGSMINTATGVFDGYVHPDYSSAMYDDDNDPVTAEVVWPEVYRRYAGSVRRIDDAVGDILQLLTDLNIATNTLVVFTSDNGPSNEDYLSLTPNYAPNFFDNYGPFDGIKRDVWEGGIRMATLVRWPGTIPTNAVSYQPSAFWDWMPTFAETAGVPAPAKTDGISLLPVLTGQRAQRESTIYVEYYFGGNTPSYTDFEAAHRGRLRNQMQAVQLNGFKGVRYNVTGHSADFEIYDVINDPKETVNLALDPAYDALQQAMKDRVLQVRRPDPSAPRPYDYEFVPPVVPQTAWSNGAVQFASFEGDWPWLPDFRSLSAVSTGTVAGLDFSIRPRAEKYGLLFSGYLDIAEDGDYTFYLTNDGGGSLRIHDALVIDDDFHHNSSEVSASIRLKAGLHPFRLAYRHLSGAETLTLKYAGPGIAKQDVPLSVFALLSSGVAARDDFASTPGNTPVIIDVLANDAPSGGCAVSGVTGPVSGHAVVTNTTVVYTPAEGFFGRDTFSYTVSGNGSSDTANVKVDVYVQDGLLWFPFNEGYGLTTFPACGSTKATLQNYPDSVSHWVEGRHNRALHLNGTNQYASISGFNGILAGLPRTEMAWIRTTSTNSGSIAGWGAWGTGNKWAFLLDSAGRVRQEIENGNVLGTTSVNDGQWHHVALSFPGGNITNAQIYVDGKPDSFSAFTSRMVDTQDNGPVMIGKDLQSRFFDGDIDELRIYNRALSQPEIQAVCNATNQAVAAWVRRHFGNATVDWQSDSDGDGGRLLLEYALGGEPWTQDSGSMCIQSDIATDRLHIRYPRRISGTHNLTYTLQISNDLTTWSTLPPEQFTMTAAGNNGEFETVEITLNTPSNKSFYIRLNISL